jgi:hypothetical protein
VLLLALVASGCSAEASPGRPGVAAGSPDPDPPIALVMTEAGLAGVPVGTSEPRWVQPGAVAAPDGSAVFLARPSPAHTAGDGFEVVRIDPRTGADQQVGVHPAGPGGDLHVAAVAPGGGRVALAAVVGDRTAVIDLDPAGGESRTTSYFGRFEPEAFGSDLDRLFAARFSPDHYNLHVLDLAAGLEEPLYTRDKQLVEDMYGAVVQATLSPDGAQLATLYRQPADPGEPAFVHLLALGSGETVCIDLPPPFGTGEPGSDAITWESYGAVAVGHRGPGAEGSTTARIDVRSIGSSTEAEHDADIGPDDAPPTVPAGIGATPGFQRFVVLAA